MFLFLDTLSVLWVLKCFFSPHCLVDVSHCQGTMGDGNDKNDNLASPLLRIQPEVEDHLQIVDSRIFTQNVICAMVKSRYIGDGHPTFNRNPYNGYINPYHWVDDHPLLYGNNGSLDPGTYNIIGTPPLGNLVF